VRLFVALLPPPDVLDELAAALDAVKPAAPPELRWTPRAQWHLTLAFLADVPVDVLPAVHAACAAACRDGSVAALRVAGAGRFGDRVLWAGIGGDRPSLIDLAGRLAMVLRAGGLDVEDRPYRPHLTLGRSVRGRAPDLRPTVAALADFRGRGWQPDGLRLMHSRLGAGPHGQALHDQLACWPLPAGP
jgi:RNA 2',3'-cyclic 3'-phosphodiesterase